MLIQRIGLSTEQYTHGMVYELDTNTGTIEADCGSEVTPDYSNPSLWKVLLKEGALGTYSEYIAAGWTNVDLEASGLFAGRFDVWVAGFEITSTSTSYEAEVAETTDIPGLALLDFPIMGWVQKKWEALNANFKNR